MLAYKPVDYNHLETLAETFVIPARGNQFLQKKHFHKAQVCRIAIGMKKKSAFNGPCTGNSYCYQHFNLRQIRKIRGSQSTVNFDVFDICCICDTTMKAMNL